MKPTDRHRAKTTPRWSIRTLLLWLALACLLPGVTAAILLFIHQYQEGQERQKRDTIRTAHALVQALDSHLLRAQAIGQTLATDDSLIRGNLKQFHQHAREIVDLTELVANIVLRDNNEQLVLNALKQFGQPLPVQPSREHVRRVFATGKPAISNLYRVPQFEHPIISVDVPVFIAGKVEYSMGISVFPEQISKLLREQNLPPRWVAVAIDSSNTIAGRNINPEKYVGRRVPPLLMQGLLKFQEASIRATTLDGADIQTAFSKSPATGWAVAIGIPYESLQRAMLLSLAKLAGIIAAMFAAGLVLAWLMGGRIAKSVSALTGPAMALGNEDSLQMPTVHIKEVSEVGLALDRAAKLLNERTSALKQREAEVAEAYTLLRNVIDSSPALIYLKDLAGHFLLVNKTYEKLIGNNPVDKSGLSADDLQVMESGGTIQFEEEIETEEGVKLYAVFKAPLRNPEGTIIGICAVAVDITPLKIAEAKIHVLVQTLEKRVEERTKELQQTNAQLTQANDQLEAFSYTVAHDLRAPLRGINGFADAVIEDYGNLLDETGREYLQRISRAALRMERLIEDLLSFSRLSRMELSIGTVSLDEVFKEVLTNLSAQIQETNTTITVAPDLPFVRANKTACIQVFQNLVSNAIKFAKVGEAPSIKVWAELCHPEREAKVLARVWVEDEGIGIPEQQQGRIFKPFERLHGIDEYQGSGIGLAIVATAVHRMQGDCGVVSEIGAGSRFWIELPVVDTGDQ